MANGFRPRPVQHCASGEMFVAICGADTRTDERAGLTQSPAGVSCETCRQLMAERAAALAEEMRRSQAGNRRRFFEQAERVKDRAALPVVWR